MTLRPSRLSYRLLASLLLLVLLLGSAAGVANAMSTEQKKIFDMGIKYFNVCNQTTSADAGSASSSASLAPKEFVKQYAQSAYDIGKAYGIPYEIILAQAAVESGWGGSSLSAVYNNFFGIKADSSWSGPSVTMSTAEEGASGRYNTNAAFRVYASPTEGFTGYAQFIHDNKRYAEALKHPGDPRGYIEEVKKAGYATASDYVGTIMSVVETINGYLRSETDLPPSSEVQFDATAPDGDSDSSQCVDDSQSASSNIVQTAINMSWPYDGKERYDKIKPEYESALKKLNWSTKLSDAQDCGHFIATVMRSSGADQDFTYGGVSNMISHMENSAKYEEITNQGNTSNLKPGDIFAISNGQGVGHIFMYIGEQSGGWQIASASYHERTANLGKAVEFTYSKLGQSYRIFRFKGDKS